MHPQSPAPVEDCVPTLRKGLWIWGQPVQLAPDSGLSSLLRAKKAQKVVSGSASHNSPLRPTPHHAVSRETLLAEAHAPAC